VCVLKISFHPHPFIATIVVIIGKSINAIDVMGLNKWVFLFLVLGPNLCIKKGDLPGLSLVCFDVCMYVKTDKLPNTSKLNLHFCK